MNALVFDAGPLISFALNNLLWLLEPLKEHFNGSFIITKKVKAEVIDKPLKSKRFGFDALQVLELAKKGVLEVVEDEYIFRKAESLINLANTIFYVHNHPIRITHFGEMEALACCIEKRANAFVMDERTTRHLIEKPKRLHLRLEKKLHTKVMINKGNLGRFSEMVRDVRVIRSVELVTVAYELGLLNRYIPSGDRQKLLDSVLWGIKLSGCAISTDEIKDIEKLES